MPDDAINQKAVIYCRVSSVTQVEEGDGLGSQEVRCRQFAENKGYNIIQVFQDKGVSGSLIDRPGMQDMLSFLRKSKEGEYAVIIDDISRLARGMKAHVDLRLAIGETGGKLESPSIEFGEDSDSQLVENLLASVAQHHRQKNAEQTKNRMRGRILNGYWPFNAPPGYRYEKGVSGHSGKVLVRDEPMASVIQEVFEGYASGRFETHSEIKRFLENCSIYPKDRKGEVQFERIREILDRVLYAGYIDVPKWNIRLQPGKHEPLISFETWQKVQNRDKEQARAPVRKDINADFPLRGFVTCGNCDHPMTACWSKGRKERYPYYLCRSKECPDYRKSVRKEQIEGEFQELLENLSPSQKLFSMAFELLKAFWEDQLQKSKLQGRSLKAEISKTEHKIVQFLERIVEADSPVLLKTYENQIKKLEEEKTGLKEKIENCGRPLKDFGETFRTAFGFLANPCKLWASDRLEDKRIVLRLVFCTKLPYYRNGGFRTAANSLPFRLLEDLKGGESELVPKVGVEPTRGCPHWILSPARLPVSPLRQTFSKTYKKVNFGNTDTKKLSLKNTIASGLSSAQIIKPGIVQQINIFSTFNYLGQLKIRVSRLLISKTNYHPFNIIFL